MFSCCAVEPDAVRGASPQTGEAKTDASPRKVKSAFSSGVSTPKATAFSPLVSPRNGNGRNIGLGLLARDPKLSLKPSTPQDSCSGVPGDWDKLPLLAKQGAGNDASDSKLLLTGQGDVNSSVSSLSAAGNDSASLTDASAAVAVQVLANEVARRDKEQYGRLRSRSSRLLLEDADEDEMSEFGIDEDEGSKVIQAASLTRRSPLQRRKSALNIHSHTLTKAVGCKSRTTYDLAAKVGSTLLKSLAMSKSEAAGETRSSTSSVGQNSAKDCPSSSPSSSSIKSKLLRRNSQFTYAESMQTAIIFDWDDTLFPTSYLIDDLRLNHKKPIREQRLPRDLMSEVVQTLQQLEAAVVKLLDLASKRGRTILVTLARSPWIGESCKNFFPLVGEKIRKLKIKVVYAQEGVQIDYDKRRMMNDGEVERMYAEMKGRAISREVDAFYSQYEGQSWKNIISIGDSDFERLGTIMMSRDYMRSRGLLKGSEENEDEPESPGAGRATNEAFRVAALPIEVNGHVYKVRTKTFKMLDCPTIGELKEEVDLIIRWLPKMVLLDDGFDADLSALDDPSLLDNIEQVLACPGKRRKEGRWYR